MNNLPERKKKNDARPSGNVAHSTLWNLLGAGVPIVIAIIAIPIIIQQLGLERFGILTIVWMFVGYFSLFDLGLGKALTKLVAEYSTRNKEKEIPQLIWSGLFLMFIFSIFGALVLAFLSSWVVSSVLNISISIRQETLYAFYLLSASIPVVLFSTGLRGVLEAKSYFKEINLIQIPLGIFSFIGPLLILPFTNSLFALVGVLFAGRIIACSVYVIFCLRYIPDLRENIKINKDEMYSLLKFGGWMTVTNIVGPLMTYMDRFFIGMVVAMSVVAYYTTPYELVSKLWVIPGALLSVLFPAFSSAMVNNHEKAMQLFLSGLKFVYVIMLPLTLTVFVFSYNGLSLWLGADFAKNSAFVLQLLVLGVFVNCLALLPYSLIQGSGRPDITAKLHLFELPFYLVVLWGLLNEYGIVGAAMAWLFRVVFDAGMLFFFFLKILPMPTLYLKQFMLLLGLAMSVYLLGYFLDSLFYKSIYMALFYVCFIVIVWNFIFSPEDKKLIFVFFMRKNKTIY